MDNPSDNKPSKSQKKREAEALQKVGEKLVDLPQSKLDVFPLSSVLRKAIMDAKAIKSFGAKRRQGQFIGKLLLKENGDEILHAFEALQKEDTGKTAAFHETELWRDRLIQEPHKAIDAFVNSYPTVELQQLKTLVQKAVSEKTRGQPLGASKALFRFLRAYLL